ncbi:effector-associated constant component EACC1 [Streptomyces sp. NRRL WC-3742]|uniref:effector-associated constant component EACC1 n=1 Tax=Streptomyces sp. NRRL WC-3742 TaxID=1463934 RepID=UPI0006902086|nr:hypothetical protein [Streptomyces sp. NRRL WC-3742]
MTGGDELRETATLWTWLRGERGLAGLVRAESRPPAEGEMGGVTDVLVVALGTGGAGAVLAGSLTAWLRTRRADVSVTVTTDAGSVKVNAHNVKPDDVVPMIREVLGEGEGGSGV